MGGGGLTRDWSARSRGVGIVKGFGRGLGIWELGGFVRGVEFLLGFVIHNGVQVGKVR